MAAKPYWRRINVHRINAGLLVVIVVVTAVYRDELRWAAAELPRLFGGDVGSPPERLLYVEGWELLETGELERAGELLERSVAVDPTCEGGYWLGEYYLRTGRRDAALRQLTRYLEIDPTIVGAWLRVAGIHADQGRTDEARAVLLRGLDYFESERPLFVPRLDPDVPERFNRKASEVHGRYSRAALMLERELSLLEGPADSGAGS